MSFLFRRNIPKEHSTTVSRTSGLNSDNTEFTNELRTLVRTFREKKREEIVDKFVERVKVLFTSVIKTESQKGHYIVERNDLTITTSNSHLLTDSDRIKISDKIKKAFSDYFVSLKINTNSANILMKWDSLNSLLEESAAYESKIVADNYNKLPYLRDEPNEKTRPVEPPEEIVEHILDQIRTSTEMYGSIPRQYTYRFPNIASTNEENSNYRETMNKVIENLPTAFNCIKGHFQRTSKNAIVSFILEFIIDI